MSRSRKKNPYYTDQQRNYDPVSDKRRANKAVRRYTHIISGSMYRKVHNSWNISDFAFYQPDDPKAWRK